MSRRRVYAPAHRGPSAEEIVAARQAQIAEENRGRAEETAAVEAARKSAEALIPMNPTDAILARLAAVEEQVRAVQDIISGRIMQ